MHYPSACFERTATPPLTKSIIKSEKHLTRLPQGEGATDTMVDLSAWTISRLGPVFMRSVIFIYLFILAAPCISSAAQVSLTWLPNDVSAKGYRVYQRQEGQVYNYDQPVWSNEGNANDATACTIDGLADDLTYYFVVRACDDAIESNDSNEVEFNASLTNLNQKPNASAGANQSVQENSLVHLDGTGSSDQDGDALTYQFMQTAGPDVGLNCAESKCSFTAPSVARTTALLFELTVGDGSGLTDTATTIILVNPDNQQNIGGDPNPDQSKARTPSGNMEPLQPAIAAPVDGGLNVNLTPRILTSSFEDPDEEDNHLLTQWHITDTNNQQDVMDLISTNDHLTDLKLPQLILDPSSHYSIRVRFFDDKGLASDWSTPAAFTTGEDDKDINKNLIPDEREVSAHADLNNDSIADIDQPMVIKSVSTYNGKYLMGVSIENNGNAFGVEAVNNVDPKVLEIPLDRGDELPFGLLAYKIKVSQPGESAYALIHFSDPIDTNRFYWTRYNSINGWQDSTGTTVADTQGYVVERSLKDGGEEDADGVANGVIIDLSGPIYPNKSRSSLTSQDDEQAAAGGGGGCFIRSLF